MSRECKLKPGDDTAEFIIKFNEMNFDVMAGLDLDHKTGIYGMVFFERLEKKREKEMSWFRKQLRRFILWLES